MNLWRQAPSMIRVPVGTPILWFPHLVPTMPPGFAACNGQVLNDRLSPLHGITLPSMNDGKYVVGGPANQSGQVVGSNSLSLATANMPPVSLNGTIGAASAGTPSGTVSVSPGGGHSHAVSDPGHAHATRGFATGLLTGINGLAMNSAASATVASNAATTGISVQSGGEHSHAATFAGAAMGNHTHSVNVTLNPGQQAPLDNRPASIVGVWIMRVR